MILAHPIQQCARLASNLSYDRVWIDHENGSRGGELRANEQESEIGGEDGTVRDVRVVAPRQESRMTGKSERSHPSASASLSNGCAMESPR